MSAGRAAVLGAALGAVLVAAACRADEATAVAPATPTAAAWPLSSNLLLVTLDTTRADALGCYGGRAEVSPNIDRLAAQSHLFERCSTAVPQTLPAHATLLSGLLPGRHRVRQNFAAPLAADVPLVAESYRSVGHATAAFVSAFVLHRRFGLARGFDHYDPDGFELGGDEHGERRGDLTVDAAVAWISAQRGPWLAWVHLFDPHAPYAAPAAFAERFPDHPYLAEVAFADAQLGRLLAALDRLGQRQRSAIVLCGDHGEGLGDHGEPSHGILLYESTTRVPLLVALPGQREGRRHPQAVGLVDLAPTLFAQLGATVASDGSSLLPLLLGRGDAEAARPVYLESLEGYFRSGWSPLHALVRDQWKYIESPRPELYDVVADPRERHDLAAARPELAAELRAALLPLIPAEGATEPGTLASPAEEAALAALGYVAGRPGAGVGSRRNPVDLIHLAALHDQALAARRRGDLGQAATLFRQELAEDPGSPLLRWYLASTLAASDPRQATALLREAIALAPSFEQPYTELCALLERQGQLAAVGPVAAAGITATADSYGRLRYYRALVTFVAGGPVNAVMADLEAAIARSLAPVNEYRLRALVHLRARHDRDAALADLARCVALLTPAEAERLRADPLLAELNGDERFAALFAAR